jgi:hypothetical protein
MHWILGNWSVILFPFQKVLFNADCCHILETVMIMSSVHIELDDWLSYVFNQQTCCLMSVSVMAPKHNMPMPSVGRSLWSQWPDILYWWLEWWGWHQAVWCSGSCHRTVELHRFTSDRWALQWLPISEPPHCAWNTCPPLSHIHSFIHLTSIPPKTSSIPILEPLSQPLAGSLLAQPPTMSSSQPPPRPSWTTVSYKRGRSKQESSDRVAEHVKDNHHLSPPTVISYWYTSLENEDSEAPPTGPATVPKPLPIYIQNVTTIPPSCSS